MSEAKPFCISKWEVWEAYKRVKANKGAAGVDEQTIEDFEKKLKKNLYKIWNRMSSGSYFPPPVRTVKIPKANGGERRLGIPTVSDRIAQQVVKSRLEPEVERLFHADSYGYRPGKSALEAVGTARERCWRYDWVLDLDIKGFFDNIDQKSTDAGGEETRQGSVEHSLYRALAESAHARRGWPVNPTGERHSARRGR
jgi:RNA-directed DNA polymerase